MQPTSSAASEVKFSGSQVGSVFRASGSGEAEPRRRRDALPLSRAPSAPLPWPARVRAERAGCTAAGRSRCARPVASQAPEAACWEEAGAPLGRMELATRSQIPKEVADIFNAPSDDEDFFGFRDDVPMETLSSEESCDSFDSLESGKKDVCFHSKYFTEELRRIFIEDTDSETEDFEGFTQSDLNRNSNPEIMLMESDLSDDDKTSLGSEEKEDDDGEEKPVSRRSRRRRGSIGLRVAFQFPTKKLANKSHKKNSSSEPSFSSSCLQDSKKTILGRKKSCRQGTQREDSASESEDDCRDGGSEDSDALLRRTMNIKENKAMLAQLLAELNSMPDFFPVRTPNSASKKRTVRRAFSEGQITRRTNPTRSARPPEKFALENFTVSASKFAEEFYSFRRRKTISGGKCQGYRRRRRASSFRPVEDITEEDLENVAITVRDKIYDKVLGNTCHQCRQKTIDTKTVCRNQGCGGVRGQFCGPCLRNRYGEDVRSALLDPDWMCPPCRGICNCSYCRKRDGRCATGILIHLAKFYGYDNVKEYLESLQKQLVEDN
ncbi:cell division cycle-associated 7-like protein isoform X2 [Dasypus novemcinctus]|uniref:cell division cycle-associated 7-like protein isoform X2 n=1 Tax=Dasypus novemcinctus TaxID=9361 RepID=UPI00265EB76A|nr:cell division cycle-associated 7-like protein isoform X2 [Dasypus novemcinctus]